MLVFAFHFHALAADGEGQAVFRGKKLSPELLPYARAQMLEELVARRLVLAYAQRLGELPTDEEIASARARALSQATARGRTLPAVLGAASASEADVRRQIAWNVAWQKYLAKYLTTEREEAYFQAHRRDLDSTELSGQPHPVATGRRRLADGGRSGPAGGGDPPGHRCRKALDGGGGEDVFGGSQPPRRRAARLDRPPRSDGRGLSTAPPFAVQKRGLRPPPVRSPFGVHLIRGRDQARE